MIDLYNHMKTKQWWLRVEVCLLWVIRDDVGSLIASIYLSFELIVTIHRLGRSRNMPLRSKFADVTIPEVNFSEYIFASLQRGGKNVAIIDAVSGRQLTYLQIADEAIKCASALYRDGLRKGDVVATCSSNSPEYGIVILAAAACGATITTCNPLYTIEEMKHQFGNSAPKLIFTVPPVYDNVREVAKSVPSIQKIYNIGKMKGVESYEDLLDGEDGSAFPRNVQVDLREDILFLPYSSGTTGLSKGVMLTHHNFVSLLSLCKVKPGYNSDCVYSVLPLFHIYGLLVIFAALDQGVRHVLDVRFNLDSMFSCIEKYKVTRFSGVPPMLLMMAKSPKLDKYDLSSLLSIGSGAAPLPKQVASVVSKRFRCRVTQGWGLTEAVPITIADAEVIPVESVGRLAPNTKIKVIDVTTKKELGPHQSGELCVKGPQVMKGYFKNPEATRNTIDVDGWLHTGDIGYYDDNELIYIVDRLKELIKFKGFQVAPAELEALLVSHPKISDAAVVGVPDVEAGEVAKAFVVKSDESLTKQEIHDFVARHVSKYKHLHGGIEFRSFIEKTKTGKILRRTYRQQAAGKAKL